MRPTRHQRRLGPCDVDGTRSTAASIPLRRHRRHASLSSGSIGRGRSSGVLYTAAMSSHASHHTAPSSSRRFGLLIVFATLSLVTLALGGWFTALGLGPWYDELATPPFQPPAWAFTPVWIGIFSLLAIATWRIARSGRSGPWTIGLYGVQLGLNAAWSLLFFALQRPDWALLEIIILDLAVIVLTLLYLRIDRPAGIMLTPYVVWLGLATAINTWIVIYNPA